MNNFRYPAHTPADTLREQALKVAEEAQEVVAAIDAGEDMHRVAEEVADTEQALETLTRKAYADIGYLQMSEARHRVCIKNNDRGRYKKGMEVLDYQPPAKKDWEDNLKPDWHWRGRGKR